ncbi:multifunctional methyltransferase subunit TRM112 homolog A-like [Apium graveolens]|uniref:multifunctional methyltransferase subunit TRM112 homolog A-like n=1 Tax=Apium graveolens TaxID=4045 RepID=UPI003D7A5B5E
MRLLTHNMLSSTIKGVTNGFPLKIEPQTITQRPVELNPVFLKNMFAKLEWKPLVEASRTMGYFELPEDVSDLSVLESEEFLQKLHHALLEIHLEEGALVCPETGRKFPVQKGIPNMMLHEDEV